VLLCCNAEVSLSQLVTARASKSETNAMYDRVFNVETRMDMDMFLSSELGVESRTMGQEIDGIINH
jgi:hypothetical protein